MRRAARGRRPLSAARRPRFSPGRHVHRCGRRGGGRCHPGTRQRRLSGGSPGRRPAVRPTPKQEGFAEIVPSSWWASRALLGVGSCHALPSSLWAGAGHTRDAVPGVRGPCDSPARGPCRRLSPRRPRGCPAARPHTQRGHTNGRVADALLKVTHVRPSRPSKHMTPHVVPDKRECFSKHQNCRKLDSFPTFKSFWSDRR